MVARNKTRKLQKIQKIQSNYNHTLITNSYIANAFKAMMKGQSKKAKMEYLYYLIRYCFRNISLATSHKLATILYKGIESSDTDKEIITSVFRYYKSLSTSNMLEPLFTKDEYAQSKMSEMEQTITPALLKKQKGLLLVDVGTGDCSIVKEFADYSGMVPVGIDIKNETQWGKEEDACNKITHIYYDGSDLVGSIHKRMGKKKVGMIMYNHALHHFGSPENIRHSLEQAYKLLSKNGILFLREHDNHLTSDIDINLQHIFIHMRHVIDHHKEWKEDDLWKYMNHHITTFSSHFFSKQSLLSLCKSIGFKLIQIRAKVPMPYLNYREISTTTFFAFTK